MLSSVASIALTVMAGARVEVAAEAAAVTADWRGTWRLG